MSEHIRQQHSNEHMKPTTVFTQADYDRAALRADVHGLLAIQRLQQQRLHRAPALRPSNPPPDRTPLYTTLAFIGVCLLGVAAIAVDGVRHALKHCDRHVEVCR